MAQMPNPRRVPVVEPGSGKLQHDWIRFFESLTGESSSGGGGGGAPAPAPAPAPSPDVLSLTAGESIVAYRAVAIGANGRAFHVDPSDPAHVHATIAVALQAASTALPFNARRSGLLNLPAGSFTPGAAVYAVAGGVLTQDASALPVAILVGVAATSSSLWVAPALAVLQDDSFDEASQDPMPVSFGLTAYAIELAKAKPANRVLAGPAAGADALPTFRALTLASADFANQGTPTQLLHGNAAGNPSWGPVSLTADVSGQLPVANGGTGLAAGTSGGVPYFSSTSTMASSALLVASALVLGGGAGAAPSTPLGLGVATQVLHGNAGGAPTWGPVSLSADVSGNLPVSHLNSGTNASSATMWRGDGTWSATVVGPFTADRFIPAGATIPSNGMYLPSANVVGLAAGTALRVSIDGSNGNIGMGASADGTARLKVEASNPTRGMLAMVRNSAAASHTGAQQQFSQNTIADWAIGQPAGENAFAFWRGRNTAADGTEIGRFTSAGLTALALIPSGSTVPTNGMFLPSANTLGWATNSVQRLTLDASGTLTASMAAVGGGAPSLVGLSGPVANHAGNFSTAKFNSQGVAWSSTGTLPGFIINGASTERPELSFYRGTRSYPEFSLRQHTTADSGAEFWAGGGVAVPLLAYAVTSSQHTFYASSGEQARINSAGLGVGATPSGNVRLHVLGNSITEGRFESSGDLTTNGPAAFFRFAGSNGLSGYFGFGGGANTFDVVNSLNGVMRFFTNNTERVRIEATGATRPALNNTYDLGLTGTRWATVYTTSLNINSTTMLTANTALTNGAAAASGTLTNAPAAGNPTKWVPINDAGTTRYIPAW